MDPAKLEAIRGAAEAAGNDKRTALCYLAAGWNTPASMVKARAARAVWADELKELFNVAPWRLDGKAGDNDAELASKWAQEQLSKPDEPVAKPKAGPKKRPN